MDLALTRRGDYAVRAALCLARAAGDGRYVKIREVAGTMALPASYTPQVQRLLAEAGLAEARAGRDGGYRLTRPPGERLVELPVHRHGTQRRVVGLERHREGIGHPGMAGAQDHVEIGIRPVEDLLVRPSVGRATAMEVDVRRDERARP